MKSDASARLRAWSFAAVWAGVIFAGSSIQQPQVPMLGPLEKYHVDFFFHMLEYALFGALLSRAVYLTWGLAGAALSFVVVLAGSLYGVSDEWHQSFVPGRDPSPVDWTADTLGAAAGTLIWRRKKREGDTCRK